jgi:protein O-mannosyl-transferase
LLLATLAAYQPAWHGGMVWDDDAHLTKPELRSWHGLARIWSDVGATLQYYPLLHTAFWIQHRLWGDATLGYHLVNILMHVLAALLLALGLRRIGVPGAWLAAAIFALHPVQVESVAWMTELKNTLSAVFYLCAALLFLRFDETRKTGWYLGALGAFVLALLTKTVTATLPGALLVILWWQRGRLSWKKDVAPLVPFFLLGAGLGIITAWWELEFNHSFGPDFEFTPVGRVLLASRIVWFLLGKVCWPAHLAFIYPRWQIDSGMWWQYLFPLAGAAILGALWAIRRWSRGPLAAVLFFVGTLFPVLGFFNLYTYRYSLVANHYQYLASAGIMALASAGAVLLLRRLLPRQRLIGPALALVLLTTLAVLTWRESRQYADAETLYRSTLRRDPASWFAYSNLGALKLESSPREALSYFDRALRLKPDLAEARGNLGIALQRTGQVHESVAECERALSINPRLPGAQSCLANGLLAIGRVQEAVTHYSEALRLKPDSADVHRGMGNALRTLGRAEEARAQYEEALRLNPGYGEAHCDLGNLFLQMGRLDEAVAQYREALPSMGDKASVLNNLGTALEGMGRFEEAVSHFREALQFRPDYTDARYNLGNILLRLGRGEEAADQYREVLRQNPEDAEAHNNLGAALIGLGRPEQAVLQFREALRIRPGYADALANLSRLTTRVETGREPR